MHHAAWSTDLENFPHSCPCRPWMLENCWLVARGSPPVGPKASMLEEGGRQVGGVGVGRVGVDY